MSRLGLLLPSPSPSPLSDLASLLPSPSPPTSTGTDFIAPLAVWSLPLTTTNTTTGFPFNFQWAPSPPASVASYEPPEPLPHEHREEPVLGWRAWNVRRRQRLGCDPDLVLGSTSSAYAWVPGHNHFACNHDARHTHPDPDCGCGFWVLSTPQHLERYVKVGAGQAVGLVRGWGRVIQHSDVGWRAEHAEPIALLDMRLGRKNKRQTKALAKTYQLPVLSRSALEWICKEHDGLLPIPPIPEQER